MLSGGMTPGYWLVFGVALIIFEVMTPGLVSLFFGLAAIAVSLLTWAFDLPEWVEWMLFVVFSIVFLLTLRRWCRTMFRGKQSQVTDELKSDVIGQRAVVTVHIQPGQPGKIEFRGASWEALSAEPLEPGTQVRIVKQESIRLTVERLK